MCSFNPIPKLVDHFGSKLFRALPLWAVWRKVWTGACASVFVLGAFAFGVETGGAQQPDPDGSGAPALKQQVPFPGQIPSPGQDAESLSYYVRHPEAPIPPVVKEQVPDPMLKRIERKRERRRQGGLGRRTQRAPTPKDIGGFPEIGPEQSWVLNENPNPSLNFNLTGTPQFAGDVNGDGTNDYLYAEFARDERTPGVLEDRTGKTALFYGGRRRNPKINSCTRSCARPAT